MFETIGLMALNYGKQVATHPASRAAVNVAHTTLMTAVTFQNVVSTLRSGRETVNELKDLGHYTKHSLKCEDETFAHFTVDEPVSMNA